MPQPITRETIEHLRNGSLAAFEHVLFLYEKPIFSYIIRLIRDKHYAEDLTQETFLKLYTHRTSIDPEKHFTSFLYTIARNTVMDWFRKQKRNQEFLILDGQERPIETIVPEAAYNPIGTWNEQHDIEAALNSLKPAYRDILLLWYKESFSYAEISSVLGLPLNTVKTHLHRAKLALEEKYKPYEKN